MGETMETVRDFIFLGSKITADGDCSHDIKRCLLLGRKAMTNLDSILKSRDITLLTKVHLVKAMVFPVVMYGCESWTIKKAEHKRIDAFWTVVLEKTLESPLDSKELKPVNPKGNQSWIFIGRTDAEAETPILWPPDAKNWLIGKDPDAGKDWGQEEKGTTEDEMVGSHHWLDGHEFEQALGVGDGQGSPGVLQSMGLQRVRHNWATELNWTEHLAQKSKSKGFAKDKQETRLSFECRTHSCHLTSPYTLPDEACVQSHSSHLVNTRKDHQRPVICKSDKGIQLINTGETYLLWNKHSALPTRPCAKGERTRFTLTRFSDLSGKNGNTYNAPGFPPGTHPLEPGS